MPAGDMLSMISTADLVFDTNQVQAGHCPLFTGHCPVDRVPVNVGVGWEDYMLHIPAIEVLCKT